MSDPELLELLRDDLQGLVREAVRAEIRRGALELRRLAAAVEELADDLAELRRALLSKQDRVTGARLVPALARLTAGRPFDAASVAALALNDRTPAAGVVRDCLAACADRDGGLRGLGRLFRRLQGVKFGRLHLQPSRGEKWLVAGFDAN